MTTLSSFKSQFNASNVLVGDQTLSGPQPGPTLVEGNLTVSGEFFVPGDLYVLGNLIFSSPTGFNVLGKLFVQGTVSGTLTCTMSVVEDFEIYGYPAVLATSAVASSTLDYFQSTTVVSSSYNVGPNLTTVTIASPILDIQQVVRVSPFTADIFLNSIVSTTQFTLFGDQTATFPASTAIRLYDSPGQHTIIMGATIPSAANSFLDLTGNPDSFTSISVKSGARFLSSTGITVGRNLAFFAANPVNTVLTLNGSNQVLNVGGDFVFRRSISPAGFANFNIGGDMISVSSTQNGINVAANATFTRPGNTNTAVLVKGSVRGLTLLSLAGDSGVSANGMQGGSLTIRGSFYGSPVSGQNTTITTAGGSVASGTGAFSAGAGGAISINGDVFNASTISANGGNISSSGVTGAPGAGGNITIFGGVYSSNIANAASVTSTGGSCNIAGNTNNGASGGVIDLGSIHNVASGTPSVNVSGGNASTSESTGAAGGASGNINIRNIASGTLTLNGGNGSATGGNGGTLTLNNCTIQALNIQAAGGASSNTALNNRTGGTGGNITSNNASGNFTGINLNGGGASGGTGTTCIGGNGGTITLTNFTGQLSGTTQLNGGSGLTTAGSFAGQPGWISSSGTINFNEVRMRTTGQTGVSGTAPTLTGINGRFFFEGNIQVKTIDNTSLTGASFGVPNSGSICTLVVENMTTLASLTDSSNNRSASQSTLCKTRIYKWNSSAQVWTAASTSNI